jgi:hypothetical protein
LLNWLPKKIFGHKKSALPSLSQPCSNLGLSDVGRNALWSKSDDLDVTIEFHKIRQGILGPESFEEKLERSYNDQSVHFDSGRLFEPLKITDRKYDLVTLSGMSAITSWLAGNRTATFTHYAGGTGSKEEDASDTRLQNEHYRVSMITDGYSEQSGAAVKFAGKFPFIAPTATVTEGGVFDKAIRGVMLFRTVFPPEQQIPHTQYQTFYTLTQTISMVSIT